jgi:hypothetical protein
MQIPLYQIQNVLKLYSRQLSLGRILGHDTPFGSDIKYYTGHKAKASTGKRQAIITKVVSNIVERIITEKPIKNNKKEITQGIEKKTEEKTNFSKDKNQFNYTLIDKNNQRTSHTLPVENSKFMVNRMIELTRKVADS